MRAARVMTARLARWQSSEAAAIDTITATKLDNGNLQFHILPFTTHKMEAPEPTAEISGDDLLRLYCEMFECRRVETAADMLYKQRKILGFLHLNNGQEAIAYGMEDGMRPSDHLITAYRDHGQYLARGGDPSTLISELLGKATGSSKGKGGSMHLFDFPRHFYGGNGIVGAQVPVGAGIALAQKRLGNDSVTFSLYGDGAANQGQIFEAYNMAALWKLPVVFVCENNHYGMGTSKERHAASRTFYTRGDYVPGVRADGMDVLAVRKATEFTAQWCRDDNGPVVLEFDSYRYVGHSMSDPGVSYRTRDEVQAVRKSRDPLEITKRRILVNNLATESDLKAREKQIKKVIDEATEAALNAPFPELSETYTDVSLNHAFPVRGRELGEYYSP